MVGKKLLPSCFDEVVVLWEIQAVSRKQCEIQYLIQRSKRESFVSLASKRDFFKYFFNKEVFLNFIFPFQQRNLRVES